MKRFVLAAIAAFFVLGLLGQGVEREVPLEESQVDRLKVAFLIEQNARKDLEIAQLQIELLKEQVSRAAEAAQQAWEKICKEKKIPIEKCQPSSDLTKILVVSPSNATPTENKPETGGNW